MNTEQMARIEVTGTGKIDAVPDRATIIFGVDHHDAVTTAARDKTVAATKKLHKALIDAGLTDKDVTSSSVNLSQRHKYVKNEHVPDGYTASSSVTIRIDGDLDRIATVLDQAVAAGATSFSGPSLSIIDIRPLRDQARKLAVEHAKAKAILYANATDVNIGKPVLIQEVNGGGYPPQAKHFQNAMSFAAGGAGGGAAGGSEELSVGTVEVSVNVLVAYPIIVNEQGIPTKKVQP